MRENINHLMHPSDRSSTEAALATTLQPLVSGLSIPLFLIRHREIGGMESAIYNLVEGISAIGTRLSVTYANEQRLSPEFLAWLHTSSIEQSVRPSYARLTQSRFVHESLFEWSRSSSEWVLYPNYFAPPSRPFRARPTAVLLLQDTQYFQSPQYYSPQRRAWLGTYMPYMFRRADAIFLMSHSELERIARYFGQAAADRCKVLRIAINWDRFDRGPVRESFSALLARPFILSVFHPWQHKNIGTLITAFDRIAQTDRDTWLYLVGNESPATRQFVKANASEEAVKRIAFLGFTSDPELGALYRSARLLVHPSLYEGFGMPPVEALGFGVPTLVSRCTSLPEVTLGLASYIDDLTNPLAWASAMQTMLREDKRYDTRTMDLVRQTYKPERIARELLAGLSVDKI